MFSGNRACNDLRFCSVKSAASCCSLHHDSVPIWRFRRPPVSKSYGQRWGYQDWILHAGRIAGCASRQICDHTFRRSVFAYNTLLLARASNKGSLEVDDKSVHGGPVFSIGFNRSRSDPRAKLLPSTSQNYPLQRTATSYLRSLTDRRGFAQQRKRISTTINSFDRQLMNDEALNLLLNAIPVRSAPEGSELWITTKTLFSLSGSYSTNSWIHHLRGGCEVQVTEQRSHDGASRLVLLRGNHQAVELTRKYFCSLDNRFSNLPESPEPPSWSSSSGFALPLSADDNASVCSPTTSPDLNDSVAPHATALGIRQPLIRQVLTRCKRHLPSERDLWRAKSKLSRGVHSVSEFLHLVEELTSIQLPRLVRRELHDITGETFNNRIAKLLCRLFANPNTSLFASTAALNQALTFCSHHSELFHQHYHLYSLARDMRLVLHSRIYSYILRAALAKGQMNVFREALTDLLLNGHKPPTSIWYTMLRTEVSVEAKLDLAVYLHGRGTLKLDLFRKPLAGQIFQSQLDIMQYAESTATELVRALDSVFGSDWMTEVCLTKVLQKCCLNQAWNTALIITHEAQRRNMMLGSNTAGRLVRILRGRGSLQDLLGFFNSHQARSIGRNDHDLIPLTFMLAWKQRWYNVCRVLWHYGATSGTITSQMQSLVSKSLLSGHQLGRSTKNTTFGGVLNADWWDRAGKVIVGVQLDDSDVEQLVDSKLPFCERQPCNLMVLLSKRPDSDDDRNRMLSLAHIIFARDLEAWKHYAVPRSARLFELLSRAYAQDLEWAQETEKHGESLPTEWMIENAIEVRLVRREISITPVLDLFY